MSTPSHPVQADTTGGYTRSWRHTDTAASINHDTDDALSGEVWRSELAELLGEVPPEALLDGPPDDDLVLRRVLRQMRSETAARRRRRHPPRLLAAAVAGIALLAAGVALGRATTPEPIMVTAAEPQGMRWSCGVPAFLA